MGKTWKAFERFVAEKLGGERVGTTGFADPDVLTPRWSVECKCRSNMPKWLYAALEQATENAQPGTQPICVWRRKGYGKRENAIVGMSFQTFRRITESTRLEPLLELLPDSAAWEAGEPDEVDPVAKFGAFLKRLWGDIGFVRGHRVGLGEDRAALWEMVLDLEKRVRDLDLEKS